jgi:DNA replication initiation complex subunit (GINS family)
MVGGGKITYETLFDLLRNEKSREELQPLDKAFYPGVVDYLRDKQQLIADNTSSAGAPGGSESIFSDVEREKTVKQLDNAKKLLRELYERREKKIMNMAIINSRTGGLLDKSALLEEEKLLFERSTQMLEGFRADILYRLLSGKEPAVAASAAAPVESAAKPDTEVQMIRFIESVPKFMGQSLEVYGPFEVDDIANLPKKIADILISKGRAEPIRA